VIFKTIFFKSVNNERVKFGDS